MTTREFQQKKPLSILFTYFKPHRGLFILDLVCATVVALHRSRLPARDAQVNVRPFAESAVPHVFYRDGRDDGGVYCARALYYVISYWGHTFGILVEADIRRDLFTHVQELDVQLL